MNDEAESFDTLESPPPQLDPSRWDVLTLAERFALTLKTLDEKALPLIPAYEHARTLLLLHLAQRAGISVVQPQIAPMFFNQGDTYIPSIGHFLCVLANDQMPVDKALAYLKPTLTGKGKDTASLDGKLVHYTDLSPLTGFDRPVTIKEGTIRYRDDIYASKNAQDMLFSFISSHSVAKFRQLVDEHMDMLPWTLAFSSDETVATSSDETVATSFVDIVATFRAHYAQLDALCGYLDLARTLREELKARVCSTAPLQNDEKQVIRQVHTILKDIPPVYVSRFLKQFEATNAVLLGIDISGINGRATLNGNPLPHLPNPHTSRLGVLGRIWQAVNTEVLPPLFRNRHNNGRTH